jgi:hypothetical protein
MESIPSNPPPQGASEAPSPANQYVINNVQQLFELNPNVTNFKSNFAVKSSSNEPFMGIVINQQALDSGENLEFKTAEQGFFSGEIVQDNNIYTNWYLALKSQKPNKVMINIQTQPVPPRQNVQIDKYNLDAHPHFHHPPPAQSGDSYFTANNVMTVVAVVAVGSALYFAYRYYKDSQGKNQQMNKMAASLLPSQSIPAPMVAPVVASSTVIPDVLSESNILPKSSIDSISAPSALDLGGSSAEDILGSDLLGQINKLPNI